MAANTGRAGIRVKRDVYCRPRLYQLVMPALCRASTPWLQGKAWMAGTSPAMTVERFRARGRKRTYRQKLNLPPACTPTLENSSAMLGLMPLATSKSALLASTSPFISLATPRPYSAAGEFGVSLSASS